MCKACGPCGAVWGRVGLCGARATATYRVDKQSEREPQRHTCRRTSMSPFWTRPDNVHSCSLCRAPLAAISIAPACPSPLCALLPGPVLPMPS